MGMVSKALERPAKALKPRGEVPTTSGARSPGKRKDGRESRPTTLPYLPAGTAATLADMGIEWSEAKAKYFRGESGLRGLAPLLGVYERTVFRRPRRSGGGSTERRPIGSDMGSEESSPVLVRLLATVFSGHPTRTG